MTVEISIKQTRETVETGYQVKTEVTFVSGISDHIFVFNTETDEYEHVAIPYDIYTYPETRAEAISSGAAYYRKTEVTVEFPQLNTAQAAAEYTANRVGYLTHLYGSATNDFIGTSTYTFSENA